MRIPSAVLVAVLFVFGSRPQIARAAVQQTTSTVVPRQVGFPPGVRRVRIPQVAGVRRDLLLNIAPLLEQSIAHGDFPGAVVVAVHRRRLIYQGVFGNRRIVPDVAPMRSDTIFDMASLTKVMATTPSVMQLLEQGKIRLDDPVVTYWPEFGRNGKDLITIREMLTHFSGLAPDIPSPELLELLHLPPMGFPGLPPNERADEPWSGEDAALRKVENSLLVNPPGVKFEYSDVNFLTLAYLVERITGERIDGYAQGHIYKPLGMRDTTFLPPERLRDRIAPTEIIDGRLRWGTVHDPTAAAMGGVSGLAGLFSTARDVGRYAQCLLDGGRVLGSRTRILGPLTILKMTSPETPVGNAEVRGLGWDLDSSFSSNRGVLFPIGSFGHTGWTGTSVWVDPVTQTYLVLLTSRVHPHAAPGTATVNVRAKLADIVAASLTDVNTTGLSNTGVAERQRAYPPQTP